MGSRHLKKLPDVYTMHCWRKKKGGGGRISLSAKNKGSRLVRTRIFQQMQRQQATPPGYQVISVTVFRLYYCPTKLTFEITANLAHH